MPCPFEGTSSHPQLYWWSLILVSGKNHIIYIARSQEKAVVLGSCKYVKIGGRRWYQRANPFVAQAHVVGWIKRVLAQIVLGSPDLILPYSLK